MQDSVEIGRLGERELHALCVPLEECVWVEVGPVLEERVKKLAEGSFSQAPVVDANGGTVIGLVSTDRLRELHAQRKTLGKGDPGIWDQGCFLQASGGVLLEHLFERLSQRKAVWVVGDTLLSEAPGEARDYGLLTISDLKRREVRALLYVLLVELETNLARLVEASFAEPREWIELLHDRDRVNIYGGWEVSKQRDMDIGPVACATLTQLLRVVQETDKLREDIGYKSKNKASKATGGIPCLRNRVMHPVRPLVLGGKDAEQVAKAVRAARLLSEKLREASAGRRRIGAGVVTGRNGQR